MDKSKFVEQQPVAVQRIIRRRLALGAGLRGEDLERALSSRVADLADTISLDGIAEILAPAEYAIPVTDELEAIIAFTPEREGMRIAARLQDALGIEVAVEDRWVAGYCHGCAAVSVLDALVNWELDDEFDAWTVVSGSDIADCSCE